MRELMRQLTAGQNQFASGGLVLMLIGGAVAWLRQIPSQLWQWIVSQSTMTITVKDEDVAFRWVRSGSSSRSS